jgi:hypothetical protein
MYNMSSAMGKRWAEVCTEMTERIRELGPSPARRRPGSQQSSAQGSPVVVAGAADEEPSRCC